MFDCLSTDDLWRTLSVCLSIDYRTVNRHSSLTIYSISCPQDFRCRPKQNHRWSHQPTHPPFLSPKKPCNSLIAPRTTSDRSCTILCIWKRRNGCTFSTMKTWNWPKSSRQPMRRWRKNMRSLNSRIFIIIHPRRFSNIWRHWKPMIALCLFNRNNFVWMNIVYDWNSSREISKPLNMFIWILSTWMNTRITSNHWRSHRWSTVRWPCDWKRKSINVNTFS